ncbi:MAG: glycine-rich domain-containing protein, partial [Parcubacteria group bacterium]
MPSYLKSKTFLHKNDKQRSRFFLSGSLAGQAFFISKIKNLIQKKSIRIVSAITLIALTSSLFFSSQAQGVNFAFIQTDWSGGVTASIATHTDNQTGWNQFSQKDSNITTVNDEVNLNIQLSTGATGGTITYTDLNGLNPRTSPAYPGGYTVHTFTSSGAFINNSNKDADYLVVAGGGGGSTGSNGGGGGGAGGMRTGVFSLTSQSYAVTIGAGGNGAIHTGAGTNGADSIFSTITSIGGGGGTINSNGVSGGSGSGAPASRSAYLGGSGFGGQGNAGGNNRSLSPYPGGGGGGASAAGANGAGSQSGKGGDGAASSISGSLVVYAGGGGSGGTFQGSLGGAGGAGGGGAGASSAVNAISGTPNTGGGGGGGWNSDTVNSGAGGSGIVIIRYLTPQSSSSIFGSIISSPYDTTVTGASLSGLQWSGTRPANTDIQFQLRTSADGVTWGPWCGPDAGAGCDSDAYFTDPTGESETIDDTQKDHLNDRYFQYKATLSSSDGLNTPTLGSVTVSYSIINAPTVATQTITNLNSVTATGNADLTDTGGENPTRYIQWGTTSSDYTDQCSADTGSTGTYSCALTNLLPDTIYFYRAKAVNSAGEAVGAEQSFRTLPSEIVVSNPTSDDVVELLADNYIVLDSGTLEAADQVTTHIDVSLTTGSNQITLPDNTAITNTEGGTFDMSAFTIKVQDVRAEIPDSLAAVKVGVSGTNLTFTNNPVAINIYIGSQHNG